MNAAAEPSVTRSGRDLHLVAGTASYYGSAAGVYVKKDGEGDGLEVTNGMFTADATLKANFGGSKIATADQFMVSGTISDFMDGDANLGFADLTLESADFGGGLDATTGAEVMPDATSVGSTFSDETNGGGTSGMWTGTFFGDSGTSTATDETDDFPTNVSGEFNGHFTNGHVAGAFGAERDTR